MSQHDFDNLLQKYLSGHCTAQEEKIVLEWYQKLIEESSLELSDGEKNTIEQKIWSGLSANIPGSSEHTPKSKVVPLFSRRFYRVAAAACFILLAGIGVYLFTSKGGHRDAFARLDVPAGYLQITNKEKNTQTVRLSDGSTVILQPEGSLYYPGAFKGDTRDVYLAGNAFFNVAHNPERHFIVHTEEGLLTEVLGTSFSILRNRQSNKVEVAVVTGRVMVYEQKGKAQSNARENAVVLTRNQKVVYNPAGKQLTASLVEDPVPLLDNDQGTSHFVFEETPLNKVVDRLEETYGITITMENEKLDNCHFTGDLSKQKLFEKLDIISQSLQCTYQVKGTTITLKGEGCR